MLRLAAALAAVAALIGAGEAAAAAPTAATGPRHGDRPTTATVSGTVNPNGTATTWHVEYGTSTTYGLQTTPASAGSGTSSVASRRRSRGSRPARRTTTAGRDEHRRHGSRERRRPTTSAAPQSWTGAATTSQRRRRTLNGTVNPSSRADDVYFEYGTSTTYGTKTPVKMRLRHEPGRGRGAVTASSGRVYHFAGRIQRRRHGRDADRTFGALSPATVATQLRPAWKDSSATLHGTVNPNGQRDDVYFEYGTSRATARRRP